MNQRFDLPFETRLLSVDSRRVPSYRFDVLVIGSGAAGSSAAVAAAEGGAEVALLTKEALGETNTVYAQGGLAAVLGPADTFEAHVEDTLQVGQGLSERAVVEDVVFGGPGVVRQLVGWGARFDRTENGELQLSREGGHSQPRVVHANGDATGREIQHAVTRTVEQHPRITAFTPAFVVDLLCAADGRVVGALSSLAEGKLAIFLAGQVILATGGSGQLYRETTNPSIATGDGVAIGFRAGAPVRDLEFVQFHPTLLYIAGAARVLISEIVRGHGGELRDRDGVRFMPAFHPAAELAPRDVVSRAVFQRMVETGDTNVYLDLSRVDGDPHRLFPGISRVCRFFGIDIARDPVPVRPGAHYQVGGLEVDLDGRTAVPGLWAVGECSSTGLHGANRMGSNSLLEALVLGTRAGTAAAASVSAGAPEAFEVRPLRARETPGFDVNVQDVTYSLKSLMWRQLGIVRERAEMEEALGRIALWTRAVSELAPDEPRTWELMNMLTVARLAALSALTREESRGVHFRSDFPDADEAWAGHTRITPCFDGARLHAAEVGFQPIGGERPVLQPR